MKAKHGEHSMSKPKCVQRRFLTYLKTDSNQVDQEPEPNCVCHCPDHTANPQHQR